MSEAESAARRAHEAWEARFKHVRAAQNWTEISSERPEMKRVSETLAKWMVAYANADAAAERAFRDIQVDELRKMEGDIGFGSKVRTLAKSPDADKEYQ